MVDQVRIVVNAVKGFTEKKTKQIALLTMRNLSETTPVDTGFARSNWVSTFGVERFEGTVGTKEGAEAGELDTGAFQVSLVRIRNEYTLEQGNINIINNVDYIRKLNEGSSTQAPAMFVERAFAAALAAAERSK